MTVVPFDVTTLLHYRNYTFMFRSVIFVVVCSASPALSSASVFSSSAPQRWSSKFVRLLSGRRSFHVVPSQPTSSVGRAAASRLYKPPPTGANDR